MNSGDNVIVPMVGNNGEVGFSGGTVGVISGGDHNHQISGSKDWCSHGVNECGKNW